MEIVRGKKSLELCQDEYIQLISGYSDVCIDLGTGDGRFVRHMAGLYPHRFFAGVDACRDNLEENSRKTLPNALFIAANALALPAELMGSAGSLTINFPWGSLLKGLLDGDEDLLQGLTGLSQPNTALEVNVNGGAMAEAGYTLEEGTSKLIQVLRSWGFAMKSPVSAGPEKLRTFPSTWAKRVAFGRDPQARVLHGTRC